MSFSYCVLGRVFNSLCCQTLTSSSTLGTGKASGIEVSYRSPPRVSQALHVTVWCGWGYIVPATKGGVAGCLSPGTSVALTVLGQIVRHSRLQYPLLRESGSITPLAGTFLQPARNSASQMAGPPCSPRDSQESSPTPQLKSINSLALSFLHSPTLISIHDQWRKPQLWLDGPLLAK